MQHKTLFEGIKCITRKYTLLSLLTVAILINVLFYLWEYILLQRGFEIWLRQHQLILLVVTTIVMVGVVSLFLYNLDTIRDEMVANLKKLIKVLRTQTPEDLWKTIQLEWVSCDDEVYEIVSVLNMKSEQIQQYINHLKYMIGYIQHEFNTPLATLSLGLERLKQDNPSIETASLHEDVEHLSAIMNSLSLLRSEESNQVALNNILLLELVEKAKHVLHSSYPDRVINYFGDAMMQVESNAIYLHVIIKNLLENAFKYSDSNCGVDITFDADQHCLSIQDHGKGMSQKEINNICLPFWQADQSRGKDHWFWLWLTLVHELAELLWIVIDVDSKEMVWTTVTLSFTGKSDA